MRTRDGGGFSSREVVGSQPGTARLCAVQLLAVSCDITRLAPVVRSVVWSGSLLYDVAVQVINDPD
jgi:hypothetical protein